MQTQKLQDYYFEVRLGYANLHGYLHLYDRVPTRGKGNRLRFLSEVPFTTCIRETENCELVGVEKERSALEKALVTALKRTGKRKAFYFTVTSLGAYERYGKTLNDLNKIHGHYRGRLQHR